MVGSLEVLGLAHRVFALRWSSGHSTSLGTEGVLRDSSNPWDADHSRFVLGDNHDQDFQRPYVQTMGKAVTLDDCRRRNVDRYWNLFGRD